MEDIVGDYADKTVTLEDFPYFDNSVKMASIHPCKHASVMKVLLDRADAALKIRLEKMRRGNGGGKGAEGRGKVESGMEGLVDEMNATHITDRRGHSSGVAGAGGDEWEVLQHEGGVSEEEEVAIRVDQYLVVFLKVWTCIPILTLSAVTFKIEKEGLTKSSPVHGLGDARDRTRFHNGRLGSASSSSSSYKQLLQLFHFRAQSHLE